MYHDQTLASHHAPCSASKIAVAHGAAWPEGKHQVAAVTRSAEWLYLGSARRGGLCGSSWVTKDEFYAGLAAAQAMPGPLFNFAAYLGEHSALA